MVWPTRGAWQRRTCAKGGARGCCTAAEAEG
ncbi:hypothetical protein ES332_D13G200800v1 [Gossypium tomentosum]|uniref:Uncharacterized protein n=1 Tax=Gossypium tomentosum TaxID=34277 RepID=A0A5D2HZK9_GOSTO|nr:hypothetical protein ES332_D13G200800v1 [Gossypium tomentosum]